MERILVRTIGEGVSEAKKLLGEIVDRNTVLFLSGGNSPIPLYQSLALDKTVHPAVVALVDERYGEPMHANSNEKMIRRTGLSTYITSQKIPFYTILQKGLSREETAVSYDAVVRKLLFNMPRSVAFLGLGADGHIAGIAPNRKDFVNPLFPNHITNEEGTSRQAFGERMVDSFNDADGPFQQRVTMTFQALSLMDRLIMWVFGEEKRKAQEDIFTQGSLEQLPGRFLNLPDIAPKVTIISDMRVLI